MFGKLLCRIVIAVVLFGPYSFAAATAPGYVFTIVMSNHDYAEIVGSVNAPYINSLIASYGLATNYMDSGTHPALPNYLYMISGATQYPGGLELAPTISPYFPSSADNLGNQLQTAGIAWRAYPESMGTACKLSASVSYTPVHDPFLYFTDIQSGAGGLCAATNVDYSQFATDLAAGTYRYAWIAPNLVSSGHDPTIDPVTALQASDAWLATEIPKILASTAFKSGGVIFLTWDQAEGRNGDSPDKVPMIIIPSAVKNAGFTSSHAYNHASYLATVEDIFGLPRLGAASTADSMMEFFPPPAPVLQSVKSRKTHGAAGTFDLPLSLVPTNPTTEPRLGPTQTIVFTFDKLPNAATATVTEGVAIAGAPTFSGNDVVVGLTGATNQQYVTVSLTNVTSTDGGTGGAGSVRVGFLAGDVNGNRVVTLFDVLSVNAALSQTVGPSNFLRDVNVSGTLTLADKLLDNSNLTKSLPAP